ncbi:MAG: preprotein translocase subunit YajC [bacterium]|nr:preprotein translocase subunit YajC [bacterium]
MKKLSLIVAMVLIKLNTLLAMAPPVGKGGSPQQAGGGLTGMLMLFLPLMLVWWFLLIRPQQKKEKERQKMLNELNKGDQVVTIGGIFGEVVQVKDDRITIKIADKTNIEVTKTAVSGKIKK